MDTRSLLFITIQLSLLLFGSASSSSMLCHENERFALLEFKKSYFNKMPDSCFFGAYDAYRKIESWKLAAESGNCCAWDGIECDIDSGHVIGVYLSDSCLSGNINSNATLFHLVHLRSLDLSYNRHLNGQVPPKILKMTNLLSLDLTYNGAMVLRKPHLLDLVQNLTKLENLSLSWVDISAPIPNVLANSSSLRSLRLDGCGLQGDFPPAIFKMPKLEFLDVSANEQLSGNLPDFHWQSSLKLLSLDGANFSGHLPPSLGNLASLNVLELGFNNFIGPIPSSIGNLTQLTELFLCDNLLMGEIPFWIENLTQLTQLFLYDNQLTGVIPSWMGQLSNLEWLDLSTNQLVGEIPSSFVNLTKLTYLDLHSNQFTGSVPSSIARHKALEVLNLHSNYFIGEVQVSLFSELKSLDILLLSFNKLSLVDDLKGTNATLAKFRSLGLASCNLTEFPIFLQKQDRMVELDLSSNSLFGEMPKWFLEMNTNNMRTLNLSNNLLACSSYRPLNFRWKFLDILDIRDNNLEGSLPIPTTSIRIYLASRNKFSGNLPSHICVLGEIRGLDLSDNNLTGALPQCLSNLSDTLTFLSLRDNNFVGEIPLVLGNGNCNLKMVDLSGNRFFGPLPRSLARCYDLEFLNLGSNRIKDIFPSWLGSLRYLRVLNLHSNKFHGAISEPETNDVFPSLQIVDLSSNNFKNCFPSMFFEGWHAMKVPSSRLENYMGGDMEGYSVDFTEFLVELITP